MSYRCRRSSCSQVALRPSRPSEPAKVDEEKAPFAFADFPWQSRNARTKDAFLGNPYFTGEFRIDDVFHYSFNRPADHAIGGRRSPARRTSRRPGRPVDVVIPS